MRVFLGSILVLSILRPPAIEKGTKLVWHYTWGTFAGGEVTTYTMGDRRRTERRNTAQYRNASGSFEPGDPSPDVVIQRCDLGQSFQLDTSRAEFISEEYPPKPFFTPEELKARGFDDPDWDTSSLPAFLVETTTVDTGEREELFGRWARYVITTIKRTPLGDTKAEPSVTVMDGWYLDYERRISCEPKPSEAPKVHDFDWVVINGRWRMLTGKIVNIEVGRRETGLLVRKGQNSLTMTLTGSNGIQMSSDIKITELFEGPLDPALFDIPPGFRRVDRLQWRPAK